MGTRHLIAVQLEGEYRVAQYGQWDGYPGGQGATVLDFLSNTFHRPTFEEKLRASSFLTREQQETSWIIEPLPEWSRDTGAKILELVQNHEPGIKLINSINFAADSLFCEWAYVIDLDTNILEVFKGFQEEPPPPDDRFANATIDDPYIADGYFPIRKIASYSLDSLPSLEQLVNDCDPDEEED